MVSSATMEHLHLKWDDIEAHVAALVESFEAKGGVCERIIAVSRGGLVPAALVATALSVRHVESIQVQLYEGSQSLGVPRIVGLRPSEAGPSGDPSQTLIVDEIVDSGATLRALAQVFPRAQAAALVARRTSGGSGEPVGDASLIVGGFIDTDCWVVFPWSPAEDRPTLDA